MSPLDKNLRKRNCEYHCKYKKKKKKKIVLSCQYFRVVFYPITNKDIIIIIVIISTIIINISITVRVSLLIKLQALSLDKKWKKGNLF